PLRRAGRRSLPPRSKRSSASRDSERMVFNSLQFVWFFAVVYTIYRLLPLVSSVERAHRAQNWLLFAASYYFYASWNYRFLALLAASTIVDYTCGRVLGVLTDSRRRKLVLTLSIGFNLTMLGFFNNYNFFADTVATPLDAARS